MEHVLGQVGQNPTPMDAGPLEISRSFNAPRERLWQAFTDAGLVAKWWAPNDYTAEVLAFDVRLGGKYHFVMRGTDGKPIYSAGEFLELRAAERLVMADSFANAAGDKVPASDYGMGEDWGDDASITITFHDELKGTKIHLTHKGVPPDQLAPCRQGWKECLDKLERLMDPSMPSHRSTRSTAKA